MKRQLVTDDEECQSEPHVKRIRPHRPPQKGHAAAMMKLQSSDSSLEDDANVDGIASVQSPRTPMRPKKVRFAPVVPKVSSSLLDR